MKRLLLALALALSLAAPAYSSTHKTTPHTSTTKKAAKPKATKCKTCARDSHGKIQRDKHAVKNFQKATGYPKGRKGYVVDHIVPLACGGSDTPSNMAWQLASDAKAKDKVERQGCTQ